MPWYAQVSEKSSLHGPRLLALYSVFDNPLSPSVQKTPTDLVGWCWPNFKIETAYGYSFFFWGGCCGNYRQFWVMIENYHELAV